MLRIVYLETKRKENFTLKKAIWMIGPALGAALALFAQDGAQVAAKFNGTWKSEAGQVRKLTFKDGVVHMEENNTNGLFILRDYPTQGQEVTMTEGVWKDSKAVGHFEGSKLVVDTVMPTGMKWHDEWTMSADGKTYEALRVLVEQGGGFPAQAGKGPGPGAAKAPAPGAAPGGGAPKGGGGAAKGKGGPAVPETFTRVP
jgi:hypothetical protein